jgi:glycine/D-amino acid oxidase-like deaminating enzyme
MTSISENQEERDGKKKFDLIIIGTGVTTSTIAYKCRSAGWEVAVIDSRLFGDTCAFHTAVTQRRYLLELQKSST